jgi:HEAT repeat protein
MVVPRSVLAVILLICLAAPARGYVDLAPTLAKLISDSRKIATIEVVEFNREKGFVVLKEVRTLKGEPAAELVRHEVTSEAGAIPRQVLQWAAPGARGVLFGSRRRALVCIGQGWYQVRTSGDGRWKLGRDRPELPLAYYGAVSRLADGIGAMIAGKDAVITVVAHGAGNEGASFDMALNRSNVPGLVRVERIRANLRMPPMVMAASANPAYLIGEGPVDEDDLAALVEKLGSPDAQVCMEAADDLRSLGRKAAPAAGPLRKLLAHPSRRVRLSAAAAVLGIASPEATALQVLQEGLASADLAERRDAAKAAGSAGAAARPLVGKLTPLLQEPDEAIRIAALQAITVLGPTAEEAVAAVAPLLDEPGLAIDAADTLGRIGPAARPALKRLAALLSAKQPAVRWAAVRAMSQIGGAEARPAVDFMVRELPEASEVEGYNMMIYFALLGPVAKDATSAIRSAHIKNPVLVPATLWAIELDKALPWLGRRRFGAGFGGQGPDFAVLIYEAYIHELGDRMRPATRLLARKILDGTAGDVPVWGYKILACAPDEAVALLAPSLSDGDIVKRERAAVALGNMGLAAAPAVEQVKAALAKTPTARERRLMAWCLREIARPQTTKDGG